MRRWYFGHTFFVSSMPLARQAETSILVARNLESNTMGNARHPNKENRVQQIKYFFVVVIMLVLTSTAFAQSDDEVTDWGSEYSQEDERLYDRTATALSGLQCPDFLDVNLGQVVKSFAKIFQGFSVDILWYKGLEERLSTLGLGKVKMENGHKGEIQGPPLLPVRGSAVYLTLIRGDERMWVTIGPYSTPVHCAK